MTANNIKFRCSSLGYIMTDARTKSELLSETAKTHCVDVFVSAKYNRNTDIQNKYTLKGLQVEEDSITLYSRLKKKVFFKNEERLSNDFITGTPDLFDGEDKRHPEIIIDLKSSWDIFTFFRSREDKLNKQYYWQLQGYMALTGAKTSRLAYCLVNTPEMLINDQKRKLMYSMAVIDADHNEDYQAACAEIDKLSIYDDIPMSERMHEIIIERNDDDIARIYQRVKDCRDWMNEHLFKVTHEPVAA